MTSKWLCRIGLHHWGPWLKPYAFQCSLRQNRFCRRCWRMDVRRVNL